VARQPTLPAVRASGGAGVRLTSRRWRDGPHRRCDAGEGEPPCTQIYRIRGSSPSPREERGEGDKYRAARARNLRAERSRGEAGFALIEIVCVLAIIGLLAAIILPAIPRATSRARLESYAVETAALLKADRSAALRRRIQVATEVNAESRLIRSGVTGRVLRLPGDVAVQAVLASRCADRAAGHSIDFFPSGMSCGGTIALARPGMGFQIRVNWLTGGVDIVPQKLL
jgi:general secretion pathway protein H